MLSYTIMRRLSADDQWTATKHVRDADSVNGALAAFGMTQAIANSSVTIATGGKTGRQYTAVPVGGKVKTEKVSNSPKPTVRTSKSVTVNTVASDAPYGRDSKGKALAPYGVKLDGTPAKRRGRKAVETVAQIEPTTDSDNNLPVDAAKFVIDAMLNGRMEFDSETFSAAAQVVAAA